LTALLALIPIYGYALIFNTYLKRSVSTSVFFTISSIIVSIFIFGMLDFLKYGTYFMFYSGVLAFVSMLVISKEKVWQFFSSIPIVIYTILSVVYLYLMQDAQLFFWDEYSHWGAFIKEMYYFGNFYDANSVASNLMYPPGISIWDYFIVLPTGFKEGSLYFAYFLILFSSTLMMYEKLQWKQVHWIILIFIMQMVVFATYGHWFSSIYIDHVVGAFFAGIILTYFIEEYDDKSLWLFTIPLVTLVLLKEVGLYFGVVFLGLVFLLRVIDYKQIQKQSLLTSILKQKKLIAILFILMVLMVSVLKIWESRQLSEGLKKPPHSLSTLVKNIVIGKKPFDDPKIQEKYNEIFTDTILNQQLHTEKISLNYNEFTYGTMSKFIKDIKLSTIGTYIFFILMISILTFLIVKKDQKIKIAFVGGYLLLTSIIYLIILYLSMPLSFNMRALNMVSFIRYINMSIMPLLFMGFWLFVYVNNKQDSKKLFIGLTSIVAVFIFITQPYLKPLYSQLENPFRKQMDVVAPKLLENIPAKSNLLVVFPLKNNGSLNIILKYMLIPAKTTVTQYNFFDKKSESDVLTEYIKYDYIWFASLNQNVINKSRQVLKAKANNQPFTLYKLEKQNNQVQVKPIL
jgi:hypothetical protein